MGISLDPHKNPIIRIYEILGRPGILGEDGPKYLHIACLPLTQFGVQETRDLVQFLHKEQWSALASKRATSLETCRLNLDGYPIVDFISERIDQWFDWAALQDLAEQSALCKRCHAALLELQPSIEHFERDRFWLGDPIMDCLEVLGPLSQCRTCGSHFALEISLEKAGLVQRYLFDALPSPLKGVSGLVWQSPEAMQGAFKDFAGFLEEVAAAAEHPIVLFFYQPIAPYEGTYFKVLPLMGQVEGETELARQLGALTGEVLSDYKALRDLYKSERRSRTGGRWLDLPPGLLLRQGDGLIAALQHPALSSGPWRSLLIYMLLAWLAESTTRQDDTIQFALPWVDEEAKDLSLEFTLTDVRRSGATIFVEDTGWRKAICRFAADVHLSAGSESLWKCWLSALKDQPPSAFKAANFIESLRSIRQHFSDHKQMPFEITGTEPEIRLRISIDNTGASSRIKFVLDSAPEYFEKTFYKETGKGTKSMSKEGQDEILADMNALARQSYTRFFEADPSDPTKPKKPPTLGLLESRGWQLWKEVVPEELRQVYVQSLRKQQGQALLIASDSASFPWELVKPYGKIDTPDGDVDFKDQWLALQFDLAQWLMGYRFPMGMIGLKRICCVATTSNIPGAVAEVQHLQDLAKALGGTCDMPTSRDQLLGLLRTNPYDVVHFACHGSFLDKDPGESAIRLPDGTSLRPWELLGSDAFSTSRPLVFMNSCHSGRTGPTLVGVSGWARQLIDLGCGAFVGCGWEVESQAASEFAIAFYDRLQSGKATLCDAMRVAREKIKSDKDSTWLAYCLYGDPRCRLRN